MVCLIGMPHMTHRTCFRQGDANSDSTDHSRQGDVDSIRIRTAIALSEVCGIVCEWSV